MWVARLKVWHRNSYTMEKTGRLKASFLSMNLNSFEHEGETWLARVLLVSGPDSDRLIAECRQDPRLTVEQVKGRQVFFSHPAKTAFYDNLLDKRVFFLKPNFATGGREYWTLGSFRKRSIQDLFGRLNADPKLSHAEMLSLKQEPVDVFLPGLFAALTDRQREAYEMACRYGYYRFPRENDVEEIARKLKVPESTFREHLRKAESKLMPALYEWLGAPPPETPKKR